jgi:hypothetical protein
MRKTVTLAYNGKSGQLGTVRADKDKTKPLQSLNNRNPAAMIRSTLSLIATVYGYARARGWSRPAKRSRLRGEPKKTNKKDHLLRVHCLEDVSLMECLSFFAFHLRRRFGCGPATGMQRARLLRCTAMSARGVPGWSTQNV